MPDAHGGAVRGGEEEVARVDGQPREGRSSGLYLPPAAAAAAADGSTSTDPPRHGHSVGRESPGVAEEEREEVWHRMEADRNGL